jgi:uncharacterized protein YpmB
LYETEDNHEQEHSIMTVLIIGIILAILGVAATLYHMNRDPDVATEALAGEYWWMAWPM